MNRLKELDSFDMNIDYRPVCESLIRGNLENSYNEYKSITRDWIDCDNLITYRTLLNSLNCGIYYYLLYKHDKSLLHCCYHCTIMLHKNVNSKNFIQISNMIINEYYDEMINNNIITMNLSLRTTLEYIEKNIQYPISLENASEMVHVNKSYLSQLFKNNTGYTFSEYVNNRKINYARDLLITTDLSIVEISRKCGYRNTSYFSTTFTKKMGISPGGFRKSYCFFKSKKNSL